VEKMRRGCGRLTYSEERLLKTQQTCLCLSNTLFHGVDTSVIYADFKGPSSCNILGGYATLDGSLLFNITILTN
jgi:hypothetical protein